jgi:hypothetical protein
LHGYVDGWWLKLIAKEYWCNYFGKDPSGATIAKNY